MKKYRSKINKILIIISFAIIALGLLSGIFVSTGLLDEFNVITHPNSPTFGFEILFQFAGSALFVYLGFLIVVFSLIVVASIWVIYAIILLIIKLTKKIKDKKILYLVLSLVAFAIVCLIIINIFFKEDKTEVIDGTIGSIAYNINPNGDYRVYIKENEEYIPYLVLDNNYRNKGTLLVRENVYAGKSGYIEYYNGTISKEKIYNEQLYMEADVNYIETSVAKFLSNEFINCYDAEISDLMINNEDFEINGKIFILTLAEVQNRADYGLPFHLNYFSDVSASAKNDIGEESVYWTRTDCGNNWCAIGMNGDLLTTIGTDARYGVRPAFAIPSDTKIKTGYIQENDELYVEKNLIDY